MKNITLLRPFLRGIPVIVAMVALSLWIASRYLGYATPLYESTVKIKLADVNEGPSSANLFKDFDVFANTNKIGAEVEVLRSKVLVSEALDSLAFDITMYRQGKIRTTELYDESPFSIMAAVKDHNWYEGRNFLQILSAQSYLLTLPQHEPVRGKFGIPLLLKEGRLLIDKNQRLLNSRTGFDLIDNYEFIIHDHKKLVDATIGKMDVTPVDKDVPIIRITFQSPVPQKAADFVNRLATTYIEDYISNKYAAANTTVQFLDNQLGDIHQRLSNSENRIKQFRDEEHITNIRQETETDLRKIAQLKIQRANLEMNLAAIDTIDQYIRRGKDHFLELAPNFEAFTDLLSTEMIKKIKQLQSEKRDLLLRYTDNDEKVKTLNDKIGDLTDYLVESIRNTRRDYAIKFHEIDNTIQESEKVFNGLPGKEKQMGMLERDFGLHEKMYNFLHQKRTEAEIARAANISFHRIIETGEVPTKPVSPNRTLLMAVSALLGLLISIGLIYLVHTVKAKVNDVQAIEKQATTPVLAATPLLNKTATQKDWFNNLALQLELRQLYQLPAVITYSSFDKREGKTFHSTQLMAAMTARGKRVLLVTAAGNRKEKNPEGMVIKEWLQAEIAQWQQQYDLIIIANEPCSQSSNALVYMAVADLNLFLLDARRTSAKRIVEAELLQKEYRLPLFHFVLNRAGYNPSLLLLAWQKIRNIFSHPSIHQA